MSGKMYMAVELGTTEADMVFEINKLRGKLQRADKKIKEKMGIIDELHDHLKGMMCENATLRNESSRAYYHKDLYETGAKIRRELAATIIEKDKSIVELVDRVNLECEKNKALTETDRMLRKVCLDYINGYQSKCIELREVSAQIGVAERLVAKLRDKYEPKLVRCEGYAACQAHGCNHWKPYVPTERLDAGSPCIGFKCIPWRGDA